MKMRLVVFALGLAVVGCSPPSSQKSNPAPAGSAPPIVKVVAVESHALDTTLDLPAQITPYEAVDVYPKVTGFLDAISVDRGSRVRAGEVIIRLSAPELEAQRGQSEAAVQSAQAQLSAAEARFASDHGTYLHLTAAAKTPGVIAGNDLLVAQQTAAADDAQVQAATRNVQAARDNLRAVSQLESYLDIRAPFDGVVTERNLHPGALVGPAAGQGGAQPIVRIESTDRLRVTVPVPEAYVAGIHEGQQVMFSVPAYPGRTFQAPVARISQSIDQNTRTMQVELDFRNANREIAPGSFAKVNWPIHRPYPTLFVPLTAVTTDQQRTFVIRIRQRKAEWVDVQTGVTSKGTTEVFGDLQAGDEVVAIASDSIRDGTAVSGQSR
ncbi:MAG TPA: efflux RND transporter periplasmic adaptor subunit [Terriglobia bacterium]|nr:efflux RND transporter periplasmic adaptor subunit [Terriglobia bacterium]